LKKILSKHEIEYLLTKEFKYLKAEETVVDSRYGLKQVTYTTSTVKGEIIPLTTWEEALMRMGYEKRIDIRAFIDHSDVRIGDRLIIDGDVYEIVLYVKYPESLHEVRLVRI